MSPKVAAQIRERSRGLCEAAIWPNCWYFANCFHHKKYKSRGGSDRPTNIAHVCTPCHTAIHAHLAGTAKFRTHRWQEEGRSEADA